METTYIEAITNKMRKVTFCLQPFSYIPVYVGTSIGFKNLTFFAQE